MEKEEVPTAVVERIESRMAATQSGVADETVEITEDQRLAMIAFVEANDRIPAEIKTNVLERLQGTTIPKAMYDRLSKNMGS